MTHTEAARRDECPLCGQKTFTCAMCGGTFSQAWSDDEAKAELDATFSVQAKHCDVVCDDCYRSLMETTA